MGINGAIKTKELLRSYCAPARGGRGEHGGNESAFHVHAIKGDGGRAQPLFLVRVLGAKILYSILVR